MAAEHIEYLVQGIDDGPMRSLHAFQLAEMCSNKESDALDRAANARFLLRANGGLIELIGLIEAIDTNDDANFVYCMMALLYFITLDSENANMLTIEAFHKILQQLSPNDPSKDDQPVAISQNEPQPKRKYLKKKRINARVDSSKEYVEQLQPLLRKESIYSSATMDITLREIILGVLYNCLMDVETQKFGMAQSVKTMNHSTIVAERKRVLRTTHAIESVVGCLETLPALSLRLLNQASFLDRDNQEYLAQQPNFVANLLNSLSNDDYDQNIKLLVLGVLINITHKYDIACNMVYQHQGTHDLLKHFSHPKCTDFDSKLLTLSALVNCVELNDENHDHVVSFTMPSGESTVSTLIDFLTEHSPSNGLENLKPEDVILSGSVALLLGCLARSDKNIIEQLPSTSHLLTVLLNFVQIQSQMGTLTQDMLDSCLDVERQIKDIINDTSPSAIRAAVLGVDSDTAAILTRLSQSSSCSSPSISEIMGSPSSDIVEVKTTSLAATPPQDAFRLKIVPMSNSNSIPKSKRRIKLTPEPLPQAKPRSNVVPKQPKSYEKPTKPSCSNSQLPSSHLDSGRKKRALERKVKFDKSSTPNKRKTQKQLLDVFDFDE